MIFCILESPADPNGEDREEDAQDEKAGPPVL